MRTPVLSTLILVLGCSGGSGAGDKKTSELSADEMRAVCETSLGFQGGPGAVHDCGEGSSYEVASLAECITGLENTASCDLRVSQVENCYADWSDPCQPPPASCEALLTCIFDQS